MRYAYRDLAAHPAAVRAGLPRAVAGSARHRNRRHPQGIATIGDRADRPAQRRGAQPPARTARPGAQFPAPVSRYSALPKTGILRLRRQSADPADGRATVRTHVDGDRTVRKEMVRIRRHPQGTDRAGDAAAARRGTAPGPGFRRHQKRRTHFSLGEGHLPGAVLPVAHRRADDLRSAQFRADLCAACPGCTTGA